MSISFQPAICPLVLPYGKYAFCTDLCVIYYIKLCDCKDEKDKVSAFEAARNPKEDIYMAIIDVENKQNLKQKAR